MPPTNPPQPDCERLKIVVDVWKYTVSVQMHFNDIEMKIRNLYFTILAASIGAIGVVQGRRIEIPRFDMRISLSIVILIAVALVSLLFYFIDRHWYHRLLQGAVKQAIEIEEMWGPQLPEIKLGSKIRDASPVRLPNKCWKWLFFFVHDPRFRQESKLHSDQKIEVLYKSVMYLVIFVAALYSLIGGITFSDRPIIFWIGVGFQERGGSAQQSVS